MLELKGVTKSYGKNKVLNNINMLIEPNEIIGLLAPNGEGKTTLVKIIIGMINRFKGEVLLNGERVNYKSRNKIAYMPDNNIIPSSWSVEDAIAYYNKYFDNYNKQKTLGIINKFNISRDSKVGALSLGNEEKLNLALTLGVDADIFMLDEPLAAVDIIAREEILKAIITEFKEGSSIIISTHLIQDIEKVFDRVILLKRGSIVENRLVEDIRESGKSVVDFYKEVYSYGNNV
ncbi:ABC transporter ATP-binding protein [Clostridium cylindrosporum]|uniref:ABC-type multidrug transport system, ATPase component n=1 Tax=Clostridium cylindrosporum DSM 605 TaxID=1121307 RepID=A0A0J8DDQ8_CLOCY|nr:ABC transporter ATP-binding protein [Clostridium cylindrosporum]KMT22358.1 ABC-type multidrug transport system, ATPase component [Clostridium cylindrosporum DSM 605]